MSDSPVTSGGLRIEIFVENVERSAKFYEVVLGFVRESDAPGYAAVRRGEAAIGICAAADLPPGHYLRARLGEGIAGAGVEIVVEVDDVDAACAQAIAAGWPLLAPLRLMSWGARDFRLADPDGFYVRVTSRG